MDVREKLVELLAEKCMATCRERGINVCSDEHCNKHKEECTGYYADHLIAHGVTVQEWISVKDRLPKDRDWVLVCHTGYATPKKAKYKDDFSPHLPIFLIDGDNGNKGEVTHWLPLPQPPKGE